MRDERLIDIPAEELRAEVLALRAQVAQYERSAAALEAVRESIQAERERFDLVVESSHDGIWDWALARDAVFCSRRFAELLGCTPETAPRTAEAILERVHPEDRAATDEAIKRCLRDGTPYRIEHRLRTDERGYRWFLSRGMSRRDARGRPERFAGSICDIDDRRNAEAALARSSATYRNLFRTSMDAILVTDLDGRIEDANRRFLQLTGYTLEALRGMRHGELTPPQWNAADRAARDEIDADGCSTRYEKELRHADGHPIPVEVQTWRVAGERPQLFALVRDRSERRDARHALQRSEDRLRIVADALPARIVYIDRNLRIGFSNRQYRDRYGLADEDISGRDVREVIGDEIFETVRRYVDIALGGRSVSFERKERLPSGKTAHVHSAYAPVVDSRGEVEGFYALLTDVSEQKRVAEALESSEQRFRSLAAGAPAAVFEADARGRLVYANRYWEGLVGLTIEEILGQGWVRMVHPDDIERVSETWREAVETGTECHIEWRARRRDGEVRWIVSRSKPILDEYDRVRGHVGMAIDVTQRRRAEEEALASAKRLETMADSVPVLIGFVDTEQRYQFNNAVCEQWYGLSRDQLRGRPVREILGEENYQTALPHIEAALRGESVETELWQTHADGKTRYLLGSFRPHHDESGRVSGYWVLAQDITAQKQDQDRIQRLAYFDSMTGLPNRQSFQTTLHESIARAEGGGESLALLFLDVDRFKQINDSLGHRGGDELLVAVADRLRSVARTAGLAGGPGALAPPVSRYGGDEFAVLLEGPVDVDRVESLAEHINERLSQPFEIGGRKLGVSATTGYALYPRDATTAEELLRKADAAMFQGKRVGRARVVGYTEQLDQRNRRRIEIEGRLRGALHQGALSVGYQVQKTARGGFVTGAEALLRWKDAELGVVEPGEFIPVAEDSGLIVPIGEWVFAQVCEQCRIWDDAGFEPIQVGVNLSPRQLHERDLTARLGEIVDTAGIEAGRIELEITESALIDDQGMVGSVVEGLRRAGFRLALDDFGTGYSSLSYLRRFPLHRLKIDRSFVSGIPGNRADCELTAAVIAMAHNLRLEVVAEGVESQIQAEFLAEQGCDALQGFLLGRAEPGHKFARRLELAKPPQRLDREPGTGGR